MLSTFIMKYIPRRNRKLPDDLMTDDKCELKHKDINSDINGNEGNIKLLNTEAISIKDDIKEMKTEMVTEKILDLKLKNITDVMDVNNKNLTSWLENISNKLDS